MLTGHIENLFLTAAFQNLIHRVELSGLRHVTQVTRVDDEIGLMRKRIDLVHGRLQRRGDIGIGSLIEADMAI